MSDPRERISSYLLGELGAEEASEFERSLREDAALRDEVERLRPVVERIEALPADAWEAPEPPPLEMPAEVGDGAASGAAEPAAREEEPAAAGAGPRRRRLRLPSLTLRPAPAAALAVALVAIGLVTGLAIDSGGSGEGVEAGGPELVLNSFDDGPAGAGGEVLVAEDGERATLEVHGLDPSGEGRFYELWLLDANGEMVALGSFRVGEEGQAQIQLPVPVSPSSYSYFDVSLQEDNGDPAHSGVSVLRGPTSAS